MLPECLLNSTSCFDVPNAKLMVLFCPSSLSSRFGHILRRICFLRKVIEGKIKVRIGVTGRRGRRRRKLLCDLKEKKILSSEGGSSRSQYVESSLWRPWACRETDC
jgi:hypothetical protein